jgi:hypothetical protein
MGEPTPGQTAYEGYVSSTGGVSAISGATLPTWEAQREEIQRAWEQAAERVIAQHAHRPGDAASGVRF